MSRRILFIFFIYYFLVLCTLTAQTYRDRHVGVQFGICASGGTHTTQFGIFLRGYYKNNWFQWNNDIRINYYYRNLGPKTPHPEIQISTGILGAFGKKVKRDNPYWSKVGNQTRYNNSIGYAYNIYINKIHTSQLTGTFMFQFGRFYWVNENDIFARPMKDRFRTAGAEIGWQEKNIRVAGTIQLWTGELGKAVQGTSYPSPAGYLDTTHSKYPFLSHGLLFFHLDYADRTYIQQWRAAAGVDAEQVRHAIQNKLMHDFILHPMEKKNPENYHLPMISKDGQQYLFQSGQTIRKPKPYLNLFYNPDVIN